MIYDLGAAFVENVGNKAGYLLQMKNNGFNVPDGFILSSQIYKDIINYNGIGKIINESLLKLNAANIGEISTELADVFADLIIPDNILAELSRRICPTKNMPYEAVEQKRI